MKEHAVARKPASLAKDPDIPDPSSDSEIPLERTKVPLEKTDSVREKFEERGRKKESDVEVPLIKKAPRPVSSPRSTPDKDLGGGSSTPSPNRSRQPSVESRELKKKDAVELHTIRLPSVRQLAQQFNVSKNLYKFCFQHARNTL